MGVSHGLHPGRDQPESHKSLPDKGGMGSGSDSLLHTLSCVLAGNVTISHIDQAKVYYKSLC